MVVENAVHTRQSAIYTTKHLFSSGCILRFNERTSFTISRSFILVTVHCTEPYSPHYGITLHQPGAAPCGQTPGPSFSLSRSAQCTGHQPISQSEARGDECRPIRGRGVTQRPALGLGNQAGVQGQPRPGLSWPLMVSVTTLQKLALTTHCSLNLNEDTCTALLQRRLTESCKSDRPFSLYFLGA